METSIAILPFIIAGAAVLFAIFRYYRPQKSQSRGVAEIAKKYRGLMAAHSLNEKDVWKKIAEEYFISLGWKGEPLSTAIKTVETAWFDYSSRQDLIRSDRTDTAELARRILAIQHGKGKDLSLSETEKIYQIVETGLKTL